MPDGGREHRPTGPAHHLAQFNIARLRLPRVSPAMASYNETLTRVLPFALGWPGFVWIMEDDIVAQAERHFGPDIAANLSLWADLESLEGFMACPPHAAAMALRDDWFIPLEGASVVLWWVPAGRRPAFAEACRRLERLRQGDAGPEAFTLEDPFPPPG